MARNEVHTTACNVSSLSSSDFFPPAAPFFPFGAPFPPPGVFLALFCDIFVRFPNVRLLMNSGVSYSLVLILMIQLKNLSLSLSLSLGGICVKLSSVRPEFESRLILGGYDRGRDWGPRAARLNQHLWLAAAQISRSLQGR